MVALAAIGTFPTATCAGVGVAYQLLSLNVLGPIGIGIVVVAALLTVGAMSIVWRHPEGIAHAETFE